MLLTHPVELVHMAYRREGGSSGEDPDSTLVGTPNHPFWSVTRQAWIELGNLQPGERLLLADGSEAVVESLQREYAPASFDNWTPGQAITGTHGTHGTPADPQTGTFTTYNFEVADWHTYFAGDVWVHNTGALCPDGFKRLSDAYARHPALVRNMDLDPRDFSNIQRTNGAGLDWAGVDPKGRSRADHVALHGTDNPNRQVHGVFHENAVDTTNEAWARVELNGIKPTTGANGNLIYDVPMGRNVGVVGGSKYADTFLPTDHVRIVVEPGGGNRVVSAFPVPFKGFER